MQIVGVVNEVRCLEPGRPKPWHFDGTESLGLDSRRVYVVPELYDVGHGSLIELGSQFGAEFASTSRQPSRPCVQFVGVRVPTTRRQRPPQIATRELYQMGQHLHQTDHLDRFESNRHRLEVPNIGRAVRVEFGSAVHPPVGADDGFDVVRIFKQVVVDRCGGAHRFVVQRQIVGQPHVHRVPGRRIEPVARRKRGSWSGFDSLVEFGAVACGESSPWQQQRQGEGGEVEDFFGAGETSRHRGSP